MIKNQNIQQSATGKGPVRGRLFVISAPSGAGKSTLCQAMRKRFPDIVYSISSTTRSPRKGEKDGVDYFFLSADKFKQKIRQGHWAEWAMVHGNYYGTSLEFLNERLALGQNVMMDIDVQGAEQIFRHYPESISIFIMPPNMDVLKSRLIERGTDTERVIAERLKNARGEIAKKDLYRHVIINDDLSAAIKEMSDLISACAGKTVSAGTLPAGETYNG